MVKKCHYLCIFNNFSVNLLKLKKHNKSKGTTHDFCNFKQINIKVKKKR